MSLKAIQDQYLRQLTLPEASDISALLPVLLGYAKQCHTVVEIGVYDCTSTWALLAAEPERMRSYDIARRAEVDQVEAAVADTSIDFKFILANSLELVLEPTELLFIDSYHTYDHLRAELERHSLKTTRFIAMHDTTAFGDVDQCGIRPGMWPAVEEFVAQGVWRIRERIMESNGLTVLERTSATA